jgi:hypothetical protein
MPLVGLYVLDMITMIRAKLSCTNLELKMSRVGVCRCLVIVA